MNELNRFSGSVSTGFCVRVRQKSEISTIEPLTVMVEKSQRHIYHICKRFRL